MKICKKCGAEYDAPKGLCPKCLKEYRARFYRLRYHARPEIRAAAIRAKVEWRKANPEKARAQKRRACKHAGIAPKIWLCQCGRYITSTRERSRCEICTEKGFWLGGNPIQEHACICGSTFTTWEGRKVCSEECRRLAARERAREKYKMTDGEIRRQKERAKYIRTRAYQIERSRRKKQACKDASFGAQWPVRKFYKQLDLMHAIPCFWCGCDTTKVTRRIDHILALSRGGPHCIQNLCVSCHDCNSLKSNKRLGHWLDLLTERGIGLSPAALDALERAVDAYLDFRDSRCGTDRVRMAC